MAIVLFEHFQQPNIRLYKDDAKVDKKIEYIISYTMILNEEGIIKKYTSYLKINIMSYESNIFPPAKDPSYSKYRSSYQKNVTSSFEIVASAAAVLHRPACRSGPIAYRQCQK